MKLSNFKSHALLYYFIIYSFIGWCLETVYMSILAGEFVKRGFLHGPILPIYGFSALLLIALIDILKNRKIIYTIGAALLITMFEYITGLFMKTLFHNMLWNYSQEFLNLQGFICLKQTIIWGILSLFFMEVLHPLISHLRVRFPSNYAKVISYAVMVCFLVDCVTTVSIYTGINTQLGQLLSIPR